jgi:hypothetical protein
MPQSKIALDFDMIAASSNYGYRYVIALAPYVIFSSAAQFIVAYRNDG